MISFAIFEWSCNNVSTHYATTLQHCDIKKSFSDVVFCNGQYLLGGLGYCLLQYVIKVYKKGVVGIQKRSSFIICKVVLIIPFKPVPVLFSHG